MPPKHKVGRSNRLGRARFQKSLIRKPEYPHEITRGLHLGVYILIYPEYDISWYISVGGVYYAAYAKLFRNGRSQAVRLPSEYRFEGSEVYVRRDPATGDVILSRRPESWEDFFEMMKNIDVPSDFLADRDDAPPQKRKLF